MEPLFIFNQTFTANSKKTNQPFFSVKLFERREALDKSVYFRDCSCFVEKAVFEKILKMGFKFGDVVDLEKAPPAYFGGTEQLIGLKLVTESPYYDL